LTLHPRTRATASAWSASSCGSRTGVPDLSVSSGRRGCLRCCHRSASVGVSMPRPADEEET
jgi:hypothetical protein